MELLSQVYGLVARLTNQWVKTNPLEVTRDTSPTTSSGRHYDSRTTEMMQALDIFGVTDGSQNYLSSVYDCKRLAEGNPIFSGIMDKIVGPAAEPESYVTVKTISGKENHPMKKVIEKDLNTMIQAVGWNSSKEEWLRNLLNEGGLSLEVLADKDGIIRGLEYRPHYTIKPMKVNGIIVDPDHSYDQVDIQSRQTIASFARWQIAEANWRESSFHDRGVPYLAASRKILSSIGDMINGVVQKWMRSGGELEVYGLKDAKEWSDVELFKANNKDQLTPSSKLLIRQIITKGDVNVQRLHGDPGNSDTAVVEFLLELIFMATGVSKEIMGFKGHLVLKDMASLSVESYFRLLNRAQARLHQVLRRACDVQMLMRFAKYGVLVEDIEYDIVGGVFTSNTTDAKIDTTVKVVEMLQSVMSQVENPQAVLETIVQVLTFDLKDYGIKFEEELIVKPEAPTGFKPKLGVKK